jgi:hypothetical protein
LLGRRHKVGDDVSRNGAHWALLTASDGSNLLKRGREVGVVSFGKNSFGLFNNDAAIEGSLQLAQK